MTNTTTTQSDIVKKLKSLFTQSNWSKINYTLEDDTVLTIEPCSYAPTVNADTVEFFMVSGTDWAGECDANTIDQLAERIIKSKKIAADYEEDKQKFYDYYNKYIKDNGGTEEQWEFYSDWHKDIYGYRPRVRPRKEV